MNRVSATLLAFAVSYQVGLAHASPELCSSDPDACEYSGPGAPDWDDDVCWNATTQVLMPPNVTGGCSTGYSLYYAEHAEIVNEVSGEMVAWKEITTDACSVPNLCVQGPPPVGAESNLICCDTWGLCFPLSEVACTNRGDQELICYNGVTNLDGSVTCFEGQPY